MVDYACIYSKTKHNEGSPETFIRDRRVEGRKAGGSGSSKAIHALSVTENPLKGKGKKKDEEGDAKIPTTTEEEVVENVRELEKGARKRKRWSAQDKGERKRVRR